MPTILKFDVYACHGSPTLGGGSYQVPTNPSLWPPRYERGLAGRGLKLGFQQTMKYIEARMRVLSLRRLSRLRALSLRHLSRVRILSLRRLGVVKVLSLIRFYVYSITKL